MPSPKLIDWEKGHDVRDRDRHQQVIDAVKELYRQPNAGKELIEKPTAVRGLALLFGRVVAAGPKAEADFPDERHWVQLQYVAVADQTENQITWQDRTDYAEGANDPPAMIVAATNPPDLAAHGHSLSPKTPVYLLVVWDAEDSPNVHYLIVSGASDSKGQYYGQDRGMVSQNEAGWYFSPLVELPPT